MHVFTWCEQNAKLFNKKPFFTIPFAILCFQPLVTIVRNLLFWYIDKK